MVAGHDHVLRPCWSRQQGEVTRRLHAGMASAGFSQAYFSQSRLTLLLEAAWDWTGGSVCVPVGRDDDAVVGRAGDRDVGLLVGAAEVLVLL